MQIEHKDIQEAKAGDHVALKVTGRVHEHDVVSKVIVIGVGNDYRRDDAVGLVVARRLREKNLDGVKVLELSGEGAALIEAWQGAERVIVIDAVHSGAEPGKIFRFEAHHQPIPTEFFRYSTHAFSIAEAIEMARALKKLPPTVIVYGIEGKNFEMGTGLSSEVERAAQSVFEQVLQFRARQDRLGERAPSPHPAPKAM